MQPIPTRPPYHLPDSGPSPTKTSVCLARSITPELSDGSTDEGCPKPPQDHSALPSTVQPPPPTHNTTHTPTPTLTHPPTDSLTPILFLQSHSPNFTGWTSGRTLESSDVAAQEGCQKPPQHYPLYFPTLLNHRGPTWSNSVQPVSAPNGTQQHNTVNKVLPLSNYPTPPNPN